MKNTSAPRESLVLAPTDSALDAEIQRIGQTLFQIADKEGSGSVFNRDWWYGRILEWSMKNEAFKTQMFRFVDVLPTLPSSQEVARHLKEYFAEGGEDLPSIFNMGVGLGSLAPSLMAGAIRKNVTQMAGLFIVGDTPDSALSTLKKSRKGKIGFTADLLGEACLGESEAIVYQSRYLELIESLGRQAQSWETVPQIDEDHRGAIPKVNISVKVSALDAQIDVKAWEHAKSRLKERLRPLMRAAMTHHCFLNFDMEQFELKDLTLEIFRELLSEAEFRSYAFFGCVIQAYLRDAGDDVRTLCQFARTRGVPFTVRLVKGAYWDYETIKAQQSGWPVPVFTDKRESDANFEGCARRLLENSDVISLAVGSHNVRSIAAAIAHANRLGLHPKALEFQMLYGMADSFKKALVAQGFRVREYSPIGELLPGMAYLVRRLLENTSNEGFLRSKFADQTSASLLLTDPRELMKKTSSDPADLETAARRSRFHNLPLLDFAEGEARQGFEQALSNVNRSELGRDWPSIIAGKKIIGQTWMESRNPAHPSQILGRVAAASTADAEQAVEAAAKAYVTWSRTSVEHRTELVEKLADLMEGARLRLAAWQVFEAAKPWREADADVAEAIDFCRYYAREMRRMGPGEHVGLVAAETSHLESIPRGVTVVIAPWNFPMAILCGMAVAGVVTGNTVVMKPAEQTPICAALLMELIEKAGFAAGVINLVQGRGEDIGDVLTTHAQTATIAFTGSREVGIHIQKVAANIKPGQRQMRRVLAELGGKNAIIVDTDADLDEAVTGVVHSAFGFAGQKCSACSRAIVLAPVYDRFLERLIETTKTLPIGDPASPVTFLGPVIDEVAQKRILSEIERAQQSGEGRLAYRAEIPAEGTFVPPTIFVDVPPDAKLAQEEIFGPVLAVLRAESIEEAIAIANGTHYALTGGLYSRSPAHIERVKREFLVGNLYINRGITGALVERHPFGGFKLSGLGSKTGGSQYLHHFMDARVTTENTMRRGFAPKDDVQEGTL